MNSLRTVLVWDAAGSPPVGDWITILWQGFEESAEPEIVSIPKLVEAHADELKARYLAWVYEFGEVRIQGRRVIDYMELRPQFSAWWMTLFAEKCNYSKSPHIADAIRLMAFDDWATNRSPGRIVLTSANGALAESIRLWCAKSGVVFEWRRIMPPNRLSWVKRAYQSIPHSMQALAWLVRQLLIRWPLRRAGLREWRQTDARVTIVSYLFNLAPSAVKDGRFESRYWAHLPDDVQREGCKTNWLHLYEKDELLPTAKAAAGSIRRFNETGRGEQTHVTLDAFISAGVVLRTLCDWAQLAWAGRCLHQAIYSSPSVALDLWPLFREDWQRSLFGKTAMRNVLCLNLFESAMRHLPKQRVGVYLQENQGWEFALIHAWRAAGHGCLIGTPHSTVRYWDLRYFFDPRSYSRTGDNALPLPDRIALNGSAARSVYLTGGYPQADMVEVEALRYLYLEEICCQSRGTRASMEFSLRVLVLGDFLWINTQQQMRLLEKAVQFLPQGVSFTVKPHPKCPVQPSDYPELRMNVTTEPVSKLLVGCDVAYASSTTSAAVDAYCAGIPVVSMLDPKTLNLSPLRGRERALFASTPEELASTLISAASIANSTVRQQDFFTIDTKLPRWRKLLLEAAP